MDKLAAQRIRLYNILIGSMKTQAISVAAELGLADQLRGGPVALSELAVRVHAKPDRLFRLLRALCGLGLFVEKGGYYELTDMGQVLRADVHGSLKPFALLLGGPSWWQAWGNLRHAVVTGECAFNHTHGLDYFSYLEERPDDRARFHDFMSHVSQMNASAIANVYPFSSFKKIVDIGGSRGDLLFAILRSAPKTSAVLFDLSAVLAGEHDIDQELVGRVERVAGDFFAAIPPGGDVYILQQILHDWDDDKALAILNNCRHVMYKKTKLLVIEAVIEPGNTPSFNKFSDLHMMVLGQGACERTQDEFKELFSKAGLCLTRTIPTGTAFTLLETELP